VPDEGCERAESLLRKLYSAKLGAQREYLENPSDPDSRYLAKFGRVWAYGQAIALELAVTRRESSQAHAMAAWLYRKYRTVRLRNGTRIGGGWNFSLNTRGDEFKDPRYVTGANAWVVGALQIYITSAIFRELPMEKQKKYRELLNSSLEGILYHQREDGLFSAGWSCQELEEATSCNYYQVLEQMGTLPIVRSVAAQNVVTEHNIDVLRVLNLASSGAKELGLDPGRYRSSKQKLIDGIFNKLYREDEDRFVTGLIRDGNGLEKPSPSSAIDNASWLSLYVDYRDLSNQRVLQISQGLEYTCKQFVKHFKVEGKTYLGCHYFTNDFEDPYIHRSCGQEEIYHLEATAGLIMGLMKFCEENPKQIRTGEFRELALKLWGEMKRFVQIHGFVYATGGIDNLMTRLESATSAIWYLQVHDHFEEKAKIRHPGIVLTK
jgi:hypothetical protein